MIGKYWILALVTVLYICLCEVRADVKSNKLNKLEFWTREPAEGRRLLKKQGKNDKYPRTFQAVEDVNGQNYILSYEEGHANDISISKYDDRVNQLVSDEATKPSGIVWKNYAKEDKLKDTKEPIPKYTKKFEASTIITKTMNNSAIKHFVKYPAKKEETGTAVKVNDGIGFLSTNEPVAFMKRNILKTTTKVTKKTNKKQVPPKRQGETPSSDAPNEEETTTTTATTRVTEDEVLNPYSITQQMTKILSEFKDANVTTESLGRTAEYNDIVLFKISLSRKDDNTKFRTSDLHKYDDNPSDKKIVFIVHGLSIMGFTQLRCVTELSQLKILISYYMEFLDKFDIFLIPIANPDGYVTLTSHYQEDPYNNKNMSPQADCRGVALDRNFDVAWNDTRDQSSCSVSYPGPNPFSEVETKAISNVFHFHGHRIIGYIHVHAGSYSSSIFKGEAVLFPRGYTDATGDDDKYMDIKGEIDEAMRNASFRVMSVTVDHMYNWYGKVLGTSVDYAAQVFGIPYALEFVMQLYTNDIYAQKETDRVDHCALTEIWSRIIRVVFKQFSKSAGLEVEEEEQ